MDMDPSLVLQFSFYPKTCHPLKLTVFLLRQFSFVSKVYSILVFGLIVVTAGNIRVALYIFVLQFQLWNIFNGIIHFCNKKQMMSLELKWMGFLHDSFVYLNLSIICCFCYNNDASFSPDVSLTAISTMVCWGFIMIE